MKIGLASAIAGIPTKKRIDGYGGIERVVSGLSKAFQKMGHETIVAGYKGTDCGDINIELDNEHELLNTPIECDVLLDFSHFKNGNAKKKYSIPMYSDKLGVNPIFPSYAVKHAFKSEGKVIPMGIEIPPLRKVKKTIDFCFVGRISQIKGLNLIEYLIKHADLKIEIAGYVDKFDGVYAHDFIDMAKEHGCNVKTDVPYDTIIDTLAKSKYFLFSPSWHVIFGPNAVESFGLVAIEALSQNTTVVTSLHRSGVLDIISPFGYVVDSLNEWVDFVKNPRKPIKDLQTYAQKYSSDAYAMRLSEQVLYM